MRETMAKSKFKTNDQVMIVSNSLQPQFKGKVGRIKKAFPSFDDNDAGEREFFYRVEVDGEALKGIARDRDLKPA